MEPLQKRLDFHAALRSAVAAEVPDLVVVGEVDAGLCPEREAVTVLTEPTVHAATELTRGVFNVTFALLTYADSEREARRVHYQVADAVLSLGELSWGGVDAWAARVTCTQEPAKLPTSAAYEWPGLISNYAAYIRTWT